MPFRAQLEECTCLTPIPSSTQGIRPELNSRNPTILPLKHHQKPCRTPYKVQQLGLTAAKSPSGGHIPLGATTSRPPGGGHVPPGAKHLKNHQILPPPPRRTPFVARRTLIQMSRIFSLSLGGNFLPPGASCTMIPLFPHYRLAGAIPPPGAAPVIYLYWFFVILVQVHHKGFAQLRSQTDEAPSPHVYKRKLVYRIRHTQVQLTQYSMCPCSYYLYELYYLLPFKSRFPPTYNITSQPPYLGFTHFLLFGNS